MEEIAGIGFKLKDFRPTFASMSVEKDPNLLVDVSAQLGHSNLVTTQRYYARISAERAGSRLERAWGERPHLERGSLATVLEILGFGSVEELRERPSSQDEKPKKGGIDLRKRLPGYY